MPTNDNCENSITIAWHRPDFKEKLFFLTSGMVMSIPFTLLTESSASQLLLESGLPIFYAQFFSIALIAPVLEEFAKAYPLFYRHGETEKSIVTLGFYAGLGFGLVEFIFFIFYFGAPIVPRASAVLFHAANTSIMAYGIAKKEPWKFYALPVALHLVNNSLALSGTARPHLIASVLLVSYVLAAVLHLKASDKIIKY
ncbi:MAG: PrsW family glutamic-type intramembrane protease [Candidatus Moranbacteria bacterium]|nr:PrsW family glutamic-type intramembrane protease [Candidatus Moranbacteria bacterium]